MRRKKYSYIFFIVIGLVLIFILVFQALNIPKSYIAYRSFELPPLINENSGQVVLFEEELSQTQDVTIYQFFPNGAIEEMNLEFISDSTFFVANVFIDKENNSRSTLFNGNYISKADSLENNQYIFKSTLPIDSLSKAVYIYVFTAEKDRTRFSSSRPVEIVNSSFSDGNNNPITAIPEYEFRVRKDGIESKLVDPIVNSVYLQIVIWICFAIGLVLSVKMFRYFRKKGNLKKVSSGKRIFDVSVAIFGLMLGLYPFLNSPKYALVENYQEEFPYYLLHNSYSYEGRVEIPADSEDEPDFSDKELRVIDSLGSIFTDGVTRYFQDSTLFNGKEVSYFNKRIPVSWGNENIKIFSYDLHILSDLILTKPCFVADINGQLKADWYFEHYRDYRLEQKFHSRDKDSLCLDFTMVQSEIAVISGALPLNPINFNVISDNHFMKPNYRKVQILPGSSIEEVIMRLLIENKILRYFVVVISLFGFIQSLRFLFIIVVQLRIRNLFFI